MVIFVDSIINYSVGKDEELRDISGLGSHFRIVPVDGFDATLHSPEDDFVGTPSGRQDHW